MTSPDDERDNSNYHFIPGKGLVEYDYLEANAEKERRAAMRRLPDWPFIGEDDNERD